MQSNSKASTVEMAIEYIKCLQKELRDTKGKLEAVEKRLENGGGAGASSGEVAAVGVESICRDGTGGAAAAAAAVPAQSATEAATEAGTG